MVAEIMDGTETCKPVATAVTAAKGYALVGGVVEGDTFRKIAGDRMVQMVQMVQGNRVIRVTEVTDQIFEIFVTAVRTEAGNLIQM